MPTFRYEALDSRGRECSGTVEASSKKDALAELSRDQLYPTALSVAGASSANGGRSKRARRRVRSGGERSRDSDPQPLGDEPPMGLGERIGEQFLSLVRILVLPRSGLLSLPSDRFFVLAFLISASLSYVRLASKGTIARLVHAVGSTAVAWPILVLLAVAVFILFGAFLKAIVGLFGKRLSLRKVLNIVGYAQAPMLLFKVVTIIGFRLASPEAQLKFLFGHYETLAIALFYGWAATVLYGIVLLIWGLVISPDARVDA